MHRVSRGMYDNVGKRREDEFDQARLTSKQVGRQCLS